MGTDTAGAVYAGVVAALDEALSHAAAEGYERPEYAALRSVAVRHAPTVRTWQGEDIDDCAECGQGFWPCGTFRDVAAAVGVEIGEGS